jgi:hypothetical protein
MSISSKLVAIVLLCLNCSCQLPQQQQIILKLAPPINMVHGSSNTGNRNADAIGDYRPGSIRRVKLQNFLTHGNVEFKPGPRYVTHHFLVAK